MKQINDKVGRQFWGCCRSSGKRMGAWTVMQAGEVVGVRGHRRRCTCLQYILKQNTEQPETLLLSLPNPTTRTQLSAQILTQCPPPGSILTPKHTLALGLSSLPEPAHR